LSASFLNNCLIASLLKKGLNEKSLQNLKRHDGVINRRNGYGSKLAGQRL
jgi:hypothetical protein